MTKRKKLTAQLPPTPCTPAMREQMVSFAEKEGRALADVQREAFSLFLSMNDSISDIPESISDSIKKGA